jgi:hypothetical protein
MGKALLIGAVGLFLIVIATHEFGHAKPLISWRFDVTWGPKNPPRSRARRRPKQLHRPLVPLAPRQARATLRIEAMI